MAGASGAATSIAPLQAYAGSGSGLTKGKLYTKSYVFIDAILPNRRLMRPSGYAAPGDRCKAEGVKQFNRTIK